MTCLNEEWKPVVGYEGFYEVSNAGRVRSLLTTRSRRARIIVPELLNGYCAVRLWKNGGRKRLSTHGLVANAFIGPRPPGAEVNHIDCVKSNNQVSNLEYATRLENVRHAIDNGRYACRRIASKLSDDDVRTVRQLLDHLTPTEIARIYNVTRGLISNIKHGRHRSAVGLQ